MDSSSISPRTTCKSRSLSDPALLAPSPQFHETLRRSSKDDHAIHKLQIPDHGIHVPNAAQLQQTPAPLSPLLDQHEIYAVVQSQSQAASPATSLPRHSRGLDFSRASTNLHHSTLAEKRDADSSPVLQKALNIPSRKMSVSSMALDSPYIGPTGMWGSLAPERSAVSSSVGSVNMLGSDSESNSSEDDASMGGDDYEDTIFATPQVHKLQNPSAYTPFTGPQAGGASTWNGSNAQSPAHASLLRTIRKARLQKNGRRNGKSSSSASNSGYSSIASPRATSPPIRSIEGMSSLGKSGRVKSRRESLALGTDGLHLSSGNDSGDEGSGTTPSTPGVVRRPVTRRGNLLPKTKGFARIRAQLIEEASPMDTESRREAETIRQVRERDSLDLGTPVTAPSSPGLLPAVPESAQEEFNRDLEADATPLGKGLGVNFSLHANRNSGGMGFWNRFDPSLRTPPPLLPPAFGRQSSSVHSDFNLESPLQPSAGDLFQRMRGRAQSTASDVSEIVPALNGNGNTSATSAVNDNMHLKKFKRRREDDFDVSTIKRRAVSPGLSAQNSPVLTHSPFSRDGWGLPPERKEKSSDPSVPCPQNVQSGRSGSTGSNSGTPTSTLPSQGKKLGLQGMVDTNDGIMNMSIE